MPCCVHVSQSGGVSHYLTSPSLFFSSRYYSLEAWFAEKVPPRTENRVWYKLHVNMCSSLPNHLPVNGTSCRSRRLSCFHIRLFCWGSTECSAIDFTWYKLRFTMFRHHRLTRVLRDLFFFASEDRLLLTTLPNISQISSMAIKHPSILSAWSALCLSGVLSLVLPSSATIPVGHIETLRFWVSFLHTVALYVDVTDQNQGCEILVLIVGSSSLSFWLASMSCNRRS